MNTIFFRSLLISALFTLAACGGGGGGGGNGGACGSIQKIAGGDSCGSGAANIAVIVTDFQSGEPSQCTGTYISRTSVLTAAHCFRRPVRAIAVVSENNFREGVQIIGHPLYNGSVDSPFDMAIVKVDAPLNGGPVPLQLSTTPAIGAEVVAYGYGLDQNYQGFLERIGAGDTPLKATFTTFVGFDQGTSVIISTGEGSTCAGDSGGPVLSQNLSGDYGIIGITRAGPNGCNAAPGRPSALSSTQTNGAIDFILRNVPDAAVN